MQTITDLEPEIREGMRAFPTTQQLFKGAIRNSLATNPVEIGWYGTITERHRGAFAIVRDGEGYDDLIGEFLQVSWKQRRVYVYCIGSTDEIDTPIALYRRAFLGLERLSVETIRARVDILK